MSRSLQLHSTLLIVKSIISFLLPVLSFLISSHPHLATSNIFIYAGCSQEKYQPTSSLFQANLNSFLSSVVSSSSQASYNSFAIGNDTSAPATGSPPPEGAIYGLYQCRGDLNLQECSKCIQSAVSQITLVCPYTYGANLQLDACFLRYEHGDFLGKLDTGLRFKKCSKSVVSVNDVDFFKRRDDVLADLSQTATGFRVASSGLVQGFAQCLGDLSPGDCTSCLSDCVGKLKSLCGSAAAAADVFLGQCYAHYWASGYYDTSPNSSNEDDVGKTVAIIVGVLAGLAVVIVFLSVCRRAIG